MSSPDTKAARQSVIRQFAYGGTSGGFVGAGLTIQDANAPYNGLNIRLASANQAFVDPNGSVNTVISFATMAIGVGINAYSGNSLDIASEAVRFRMLGINRVYHHAGTGFAGSGANVTHGAVQTTSATSAAVFTSAALLDNSGTSIEVRVVGRETGSTNRGMAVRRALVTRQAGGSAALVGAVEATYTNMPATWGAGVALTQATIDVTGNTFRVICQGAAATTINWAVEVRYQSVSGST